MTVPKLFLLATLLFWPSPGVTLARQASTLLVPAAPAVINGGLDCGSGYHVQDGVNGVVPDGWSAVVKNEGTPYLTSTQLWGRDGSCNPDEPWWKWEKIEGHDSFLFMGGYAPLGQDFPSPPFDATLYQRVRVSPGIAYSLSAWMMSLCGGSAMPNDCPPGQYISKMVGVDATGNTDPEAGTVMWLEDSRPHFESWWVDFSPVVKPQGEHVTIFLRVRSPFTHHGNHVFADGVQLVTAPSAEFSRIERNEDAITVGWRGDLEGDIRAIPAGNYKLRFTVEFQAGTGRPWQNWQADTTDAAAAFPLPRLCSDAAYRFRVRAIAEQPSGEDGSWPPHRFVGMWQESETVSVAAAFHCTTRQWLPMTGR